MEKAREERRAAMEERKMKKIEKEQLNKQLGKNVDIDFEMIMDQHRFKEKLFQKHTMATDVKLCVNVRKRPLFQKEEKNGEIDAISCANPSIRVHAPKFKVDGITKYVENSDFTFDNTFHENEESLDVYNYSLKPLVDSIFQGSIITVIAYGQTGSGKTFTMEGVQDGFINDLFERLNGKYKSQKLSAYLSFFEIYGGRLYDLLNNKNQLFVLEDKNNSVQINGLVENKIENYKDLQGHIEYANSVRTTHQTTANDTSSRSHAICQIQLKDNNGVQVGKVYLVDLAGSERAQDCQSNNRQRRLEGAEINKSLLALKECIRAMDMGSNHVPFRASKLTLVLRDSFQGKSNKNKVIFVACISPGSSSADHTINTLRYVDRLKEKSPVVVKAGNMPSDQNQNFSRKESPARQLNNYSQQSTQASEKNNNKEQQQPPSKKIPPSVNNQQNQPLFHKQSSPRQGGANKPISANNNNNNSNNNNGKQRFSSGDNRVPQKNNNNNNNNIQQNQNQNGNNKISKQGAKANGQQGSDEEISPKVKGVKDDVRCMKETMKIDKMSNEFFDFHEKVGNILEQQEEIFATHMAAIKEDAKLLTQESELISNVQGIGFMDYDIDEYAKKLESVVQKKLKMYNLLAKKLDLFKKNLQEEEEISHKVNKETFYF